MIKSTRQYRAVPSFDEVMKSEQAKPIPSFDEVMGGDKKKVPTVGGDVSNNSSQNTNLSLGGEKNQVSQTDKNALANFAQNLNKGNGQNVVKNIPTKNVLTQVGSKRRLTNEEVEKKAQERLSDPYNQLAANNSDDPIGSYYNTIQNSKASSITGKDKIQDENEAAIHDKMGEMVVANTFPTSQSASDYLHNELKKKTGQDVPIGEIDLPTLKQQLPDNLSTRTAIQKLGNNRFLTSLMNESKNFGEFVDKYKNASSKFIGMDDERQQAQAYQQILNDPDVAEVAKQNPKTWGEYLQERHNFINKFPDLAKQDIASKISQYREDVGKNNKIFNNPSKESWDKVVDEMYAKGKIDAQEKAFYNQNIKPSDLKTTGLIESVGRGYEEGIRQIGQTIGLQDLGLLKDMSKESQVNPTNNKILGGGGHLMGNIVPMLLTGGALKGAGFGEKAANGFAAMLQFGGGNAEQAKKYFPNNPIGQFAYTALGTTIDTMLMDLPTRAQQGIRQLISGEAKQLAAKLSDTAMSDAVKEQMKQSFVNKFINASKRYGVDILKHNAQTSGVLTSVDLLHKGLNLAAGDKSAFEGTDLPKEFVDNFLMASPLSAISAAGALLPKQKSELNTAINELPDNMYTSEIKKSFNEGNVLKLETYLKDISEQLNNPQSSEVTRKVFGEKLSDIATKLYPNAKSEPINIEQSINRGSGENITEGEQGMGGELGKGVEVGTNSSGEGVGDKAVSYNGIFSTTESSRTHKGKGERTPITEGDGWKVVFMSPDEYLSMTEKGFRKNIAEVLKKDPSEVNYENNLNKDSREVIHKAVSEDAKLDMPFIEYDENGKMKSQDGRNRANYAKENGETSIPVMIKGEQPNNSSGEGVGDKTVERLVDNLKGKGFKENADGGLVRGDVGLRVKDNLKLGDDGNYQKDDNSIVIDDIAVTKKSRGKGIGAAAMNDILNYADENGKEIYLEPMVNRTDSKMTKEQLVDWYKKFGFDVVNENVMVRQPKQKQSTNEILEPTEKESTPIKEPNQNIQPTSEGEKAIEQSPIGKPIEVQQQEQEQRQPPNGIEPPSETPPVGKKGVYAERPATELSYRGLQNVANEFGLNDVTPRDRKSDIQLRKDAENTINSWVEKGEYKERTNGLLNKAENGGILTDEERIIFQQHIANTIGEARKLDKLSPEYDAKLQEIRRLKDAGEITRSAAGAALRIPSNSGSYPRTVEDAMVERMGAAGVDTLTPEQKKDVEEKFSMYESKQKEAEERIVDLEKKNMELQAEIELAKQRKATKPVKKDFKAERQNIRNSIKEKWAKAANDNTLTAVPLPYAKQLAAISPDVAKLMKSYIEEGITTFSEIVDKIHDDIKDVVKNREDVIDILAGKYNEPKESKIDLLTKLKQIKDKKSAEAIKIIAKLRTGDFEKAKKPKSIFDNPDLIKKYPKEYKQTMDAIVASEKAKHELALANLNEEMKNRTWGQKTVGEFGRVFRTLKALKAGIDDSGVGVQTLLAGLANPVSFAAAFKEHLLDAMSAARFERNLARLHNSDFWPLIEKSGLSVVDPKSLRESEKNDIFNDTYFDYMKVKIKGKEYSFAFTKPFERAFTSLGNNLRVNMFLRRAEQLMNNKKNPMTYETHPEEFEALAKVINNLSGRGTMNKGLEAHNQLLSTVLWSPKLLASSINVLGLGEFSGKGFYRSLTPMQRRYVAAQLVNGIGTGIILMAILSTSQDGESDLDPLSPTFGTVKVGGYRYTIFGRYNSVVRTAAMIIMREKHTTKGVDDLTDRRGTSLQDELIKFVRGKANPTLGIGWDVVTGKTYEGKPTDPMTEISQSAIPMSVDDIRKGLAQDGTLGILKRGIPSFFGVKVSHEKDFAKPSGNGGAGAKGSFKKSSKQHNKSSKSK